MSDHSSNPFVHSVADLSADHAPRRSIVIETPVDWSVELSRTEPEPPLAADLTLTRTRGGVIVTGRIDVDVRHTCPRCLTDHVEPLTVEVAQLIAEPSGEEDDDEIDYVLDGEVADLEPMLRDETLLAMPLLPTCPEGCAELVPQDQTDLNTDVPGDESRDSSPFAVLQDLIEHAD